MSDTRIQNIIRQISESEGLQDSANAARLHALKDEYNALIDQHPGEGSKPPRDMMAVLPDSVWIEIIHMALPQTGYVVALLTLTMVSERWLLELTSVPTLWSRIEFLSTFGDFESSLETCVHLSRQCAVDLVLFVPFPEDSAALTVLVNKIRTRLRSVSWTNTPYMPSSVHWTRYHDMLYSASKTTIHLFEELSSIETFDIYYNPTGSWRDRQLAEIITDANAPPNLRNLTGWVLGEEDLQKSPLLMQRLHTLDCRLLLSQLSDVLAVEAKPRELSFTYYHHQALPKEKENLSFQPLGRWSSITSFSYCADFRNYILQFLAILAPNISDLGITVPFSKADRILLLLGDFRRLKTLSISFSCRRVGDQGTNVANYSAIPDSGSDTGILTQLSLHFLNPDSSRDAAYDPAAVPVIFGYFARTYLHVRSATFYLGHGKLFQPLCNYVTAHEALTDLSILDQMAGVWDRPDSAQFSETKDPPYLRTSILNSVSLVWRNDFNKKHMLAGFDTRRLTITCYTDVDQIKIRPGSFPSLTEIDIQMSWHRDALPGSVDFVSLPELTTFHLSAPTRGHSLATKLCLQLFAKPDFCLRLSTLSFGDAQPEWDILVLMLEARNFLPGSGISRIRTLTLPRTPEWMRSILLNLLRGHFIQRPDNEELSFKGVQNLCFDPKIMGCYTCLRYMLSPCDLLVLYVSSSERRDINQWDEISFDDTILDCTGLLWAEGLPASPWIAKRGELLADWTQERKHWSETYSRSWMCKKREQDTKVRINEHDRVDYYESVEGL